MKTQKQIIAFLAKQAGGFSKLAELIEVPQSRVSEWYREVHAMSVPTLLLMIESLGLTMDIFDEL